MNVSVILGVLILVVLIGLSIYHFFKLNKEAKIKNVKEWLKWGVVEAEKHLGSGTGQLKLREVYNLAVKQFPWLVTLVTFEMFNEWVKEALEWMEKQIDENPMIKNYIGR